MFIELTDHLRCPADHDEAFLPHPLGKGGEGGIAIVCQSEQLEQSIDLRVETPFVQVAKAADQPKVLWRGQVGVEVWLLGHVAELPPEAREIPKIERPSQRTSPEQGDISPTSIRTVVDLPEPFGPRQPRICPGRAVNDASRSAGRAP